ncbi:MAG: TlpA family protein disulfide reductase [Marinospirillum sp.]|nr:TlpA family protein disulfide reductase [Marinospirillum sp.]
MLGVTAVDFIPSVRAAELVPIAQAQQAPLLNQRLPDMKGGDASLAELQGKVVLVDFWASWCGPCRESFPWMNAMQEKYAKQGLVVVGVNLDQQPQQALDFLQQVPANFTLLQDSKASLPEAYGLIGMPSSYLLDRQGRLRATHTGFHASRVNEYEASIQQLLAE